MKFNAAPITGAVVIELTPLLDERGFFARSWCQDEFEAHGLETRIARWNDPDFGIVWPVPVVLMSERDRQHADFSF